MSAQTASQPVRTGAAPPEAMSHRQILEALSGLLLVLFVAITSATIVSTALPKILAALHGNQSEYTWVVTATLLTATASIPIWGKLADLFSKKAVIQASIVLFVIGSLLCGFAQNIGELIAARAFQGIGMGGLQALGQVVIAAMVGPRQRARYNSYLGSVTAVATVAGPLLGGVIVDTSWLGWRWCFFLGVPVSVIAFVVLQKTLKLVTVRRDAQIDYLGATLIAAGVSVLLIWVTFVGNSFAWLSWQTAAMVLGGLAVIGLALWVESRVAEPVVPLRVIVQKTPALAIIVSISVGMALYGASVFLGQYYQVARGYSPTEAGLLTIPMMAGIMIATTMAGRLIARTGVIKPYILAGTIVLVAGFGLLASIDHRTNLGLIATGMLLVGIGVGLTVQNLVLVVQNSVASGDLGSASGGVTFFRSLGGTIGVSVLGAVLANRVSATVTERLAAAGTQSASGSSLDLKVLPAPVREIVRAAYGDATGRIFLIAAIIAAIGVIAAFFLPKVALRATAD